MFRKVSSGDQLFLGYLCELDALGSVFVAGGRTSLLVAGGEDGGVTRQQSDGQRFDPPDEGQRRPRPLDGQRPRDRRHPAVVLEQPAERRDRHAERTRLDRWKEERWRMTSRGNEMDGNEKRRRSVPIPSGRPAASQRRI